MPKVNNQVCKYIASDSFFEFFHSFNMLIVVHIEMSLNTKLMLTHIISLYNCTFGSEQQLIVGEDGGCSHSWKQLMYMIYSFGSQCSSCSMLNLLYYFLLQYVPVTFIFLAILWSRYSIVSPPMAHFVLYCNIVHAAFKTNLGQYCIFASPHTLLVRLLFTVNSLWTLDPFYFVSPPLCISERVSEINIPFFDAFSALYPFVLLLIIYFSIELYARDCKLFVFLWKLSKCRVLFNSWNN